MIKKLLLGIAAVIVLVLVVAFFQPDEYRISRSITIAAPPSIVFPHVNNLRRMNEWSPWIKIDPNAKQTYEGPDEGVGASYSWDGNKDVGAGKMTLTESRPHEAVAFRLDFLRPFPSVATTEFTFQNQGMQTTLTQTMQGRKPFLNKIVCLFMNMDKMIGGQFEKGFASLKGIIEGTPKT